VNLEGPAEEDPGEALAQQLIQYRRFKQISDWLSQREESSLHTYLRLAPPPIKVEPKLDLSDLTLEELVSTAADIFFAEPDAVNLSEVVNMPRVTIREKIHTILETAKLMSSPSFRSILSGWNRVEVVVTFLALLELIKRHIIEANQDNLFGDIHFQSRQEWSEDELIEIDFDE
jgi:segregation and condensation protein A